jgi:hypothetical protein
MKKSTESLIASPINVPHLFNHIPHLYAPFHVKYVGRQTGNRLSANYAKEGGENGVIHDLAWKFAGSKSTNQF